MLQKGRRSIIAPHKQIQAQNGHVVLILGGDVAMIRAYHIENAVLPLFARRVRSYLRVRYVVPSRRNTRLKRLFEERGVKHSVGVFAIFANASGRFHVVWLHGVFVGWFAAKYTLSV